jgi:hypothetical protein
VALRDPTTIVLWLLAAFAAVEAAAGLTLLIGGLATGSALYSGGGLVLLAIAARTIYRRHAARRLARLGRPPGAT